MPCSMRLEWMSLTRSGDVSPRPDGRPGHDAKVGILSHVLERTALGERVSLGCARSVRHRGYQPWPLPPAGIDRV